MLNNVIALTWIQLDGSFSNLLWAATYLENMLVKVFDPIGICLDKNLLDVKHGCSALVVM
jgi:hypothetical protein